MSPASKYKPKFKKAGKEPQNTSMKLQGNANSSNGGPANAYNPLLGTFHMLDAAPEFSAPSQVNSRFRTIDDTDDPSGTSLTGPEYDSVSNNGSWSGDSEDHRDKPPAPATRQEAIPGADNDKREKIRQKNERKHRRQKERRAHELHERCCGYLMSRKLEGLAQKLVAMGFSSERAMMALILNEGKLEESVTWLFEGHEEEEDKHDDRNNLKLDISKELARIDDMEVKYGCSKQEVERAIVSCEGDLRKAAEFLKMQKPEEENGDPPKNEDSRASLGAKPLPKDELTNHGKADFGSKNGPPPLPLPLPPKKFQSKPEVRELAMDKTSRWLGGSSILASSSPAQVSTAVPAGMVREPVVMMQRPKPFATTEQTPTTSNGMLQTRSLSPNRLRLNQLYLQNHQRHHDLQNHHPHHHHHHHPSHQQSFNPVPTVAPASSLGLFSGLGSGGRVLGSSSSPVDWSTGSSSSSLDYSSIDWSLDRGLSSQKPNGLWLGLDPSRRFPTTVMSGPVPVPVSQSGGEGDACVDSPAEWTTPFEGQDLLSVPRRFVSSPPL